MLCTDRPDPPACKAPQDSPAGAGAGLPVQEQQAGPGAKPASRAGKSGSVTWLEKSKCTACISENGKSDLDNESPVSLTSLAHGLGARSEREIVQKQGNGSCRALGSSHCSPTLGWVWEVLLARADLNRTFHWEILK